MKIKTLKIISLVILLLPLLFSCRVNPSRMLETDRNYEYDQPPNDSISEYKISPSDFISFKLFSNDGFKIIDLTAINESGSARNLDDASIKYLVEYDGQVKLPILGRVKLSGMTIKEAEFFLETEYSKYYNNPFVLLKVLNRRVTIFTGSEKGKVITLNNENTTIIEALAQVGGLTKESKAYKIKLVRGDLKNPDVFLFDFSTLEGLKESDFVLQANDIIYVESKANIVLEIVRDVAPIVSLISSAITLIIVMDRFNN